MDTFRLQALSEVSLAKTSSLPPPLRTPVDLSPGPAVPPTAGSLCPTAEGAADIAGEVFDHFAAAWKARLDSFLTADPLSRA